MFKAIILLVTLLRIKSNNAVMQYLYLSYAVGDKPGILSEYCSEGLDAFRFFLKK